MAEIQVRRANVLLRVPEEQKGEYLAKGFDVVDSNGVVKELSIPNDVNVLKAAYADHTARIKQLEEEVAQLKAKSVKPAVTKKEPTEDSSVKTSTKSNNTRSKKINK